MLIKASHAAELRFFFYLLMNGWWNKYDHLVLKSKQSNVYLASRFGIKYARFMQKLSGLVKAGILSRVKYGVYQINKENLTVE